MERPRRRNHRRRMERERQRPKRVSVEGAQTLALLLKLKPRTSGSARFGVFGGEPLMLSRCCVCARPLVAFQRHVSGKDE